MKPTKEKILYDTRNTVWKDIQNHSRFDVWSEVTWKMSNRVADIIWVRVHAHVLEKLI